MGKGSEIAARRSEMLGVMDSVPFDLVSDLAFYNKNVCILDFINNMCSFNKNKIIQNKSRNNVEILYFTLRYSGLISNTRSHFNQILIISFPGTQIFYTFIRYTMSTKNCTAYYFKKSYFFYLRKPTK